MGGPTQTLPSFKRPPFIFFEWVDFNRMWFYLYPRSRRLARALVDDGRPIIFVQPPSRGYKTSKELVFEEIESGIWRCPIWPDNQQHIEDNLSDLARLFPDSPWVFRHANWMPFLKDEFFESRVIVYDCDGWEDGSLPNMKERRLASSANFVLTNSMPMLGKLGRFNENVVYLPDGRLLTRIRKSMSEPGDLAGIARPRLLVAGFDYNLLDLDLMELISRARPDWSIIALMPFHQSDKQWVKRENVHFLGERMHCELPMYMGYCDVGLMPLLQASQSFVVNTPIVNDYMAWNIPVVSSCLPNSLGLFDSGVRVTSDHGTFLSAIESTLSLQESKAEPTRIAEGFQTWAQQAKRLARLVDGESDSGDESSVRMNLAKYLGMLESAMASGQFDELLAEEVTCAAYADGQYEQVLEMARPDELIFGCALIRLGKHARARAWLDAFSTCAGNDSVDFLNQLDDTSLASYLYQLNDEHVSALQNLAGVNDQTPMHYLLCARAWFGLGFADSATFFYSEVVQREPSLLQARDYLSMGDLMFQHQHGHDAEDAYLKAYQLGLRKEAERRLALVYERLAFESEKVKDRMSPGKVIVD